MSAHVRSSLMVLTMALSATACSNDGASGDDTATKADTVDGPIGPHDETVRGPHGGTMVRITAGIFDMGCTAVQSAHCLDNERPPLTVTLTHDFYMGETEVTRGEYESMTGVSPSDDTACGNDCPMVAASWHMAAAFANALSSSEGLTACYTCSDGDEDIECEVAMSPYDCDGYRLPTEAEWEGAARCGEDLLYAGSNQLDDVGWHAGNSEGNLHPVAGKEANACRLYDMSGNAWEWVQDWYLPGYDTSGDGVDPEGAESGGNRVHRGGSWDSAGSRARVSHRDENYPAFAAYDLGFRLARTVP